jgi:hypothetical protein
VLVVAAPYLLGTLADHLGLHTAFTVEPVLIGACALLLLAGLRLEQRADQIQSRDRLVMAAGAGCRPAALITPGEESSPGDADGDLQDIRGGPQA